MKKTIPFYIVGGVLALLLAAYVIYLVNVIVSNISVISGTNLLNPPAIATYNFDKFKQIKGVPQQ